MTLLVLGLDFKYKTLNFMVYHNLNIELSIVYLVM